MAAPAFQRQVLAELSALGGVAAAALGPFRIRAGYGALTLVVHLDEVFKRYRHQELEPADAAAEIAAALGVPSAGVALAGPFPRLARLGRAPAGAWTRPCPFDPDLEVFYVHELPSGHLPIMAAEATGEDLHARAIANLAERTRRVPADTQGEGDALVLGYATADGFDEARALLRDLLAAMAEWVAGSLLVAIPSRDLLMAIGDADPRFVAEAGAHVAAVAARDPDALSPRWYRWAGGELARVD